MGTLNLWQKMPEKMQKTRNEYNHPGLRNYPRTIKKNWSKSTLAFFYQFLDVFLAQYDRIHLQSFASFQAFWDTSLALCSVDINFKVKIFIFSNVLWYRTLMRAGDILFSSFAKFSATLLYVQLLFIIFVLLYYPSVPTLMFCTFQINCLKKTSPLFFARV